MEIDALYTEMNTKEILSKYPLERLSGKMVKRTFDIIAALLVLVSIFPLAFIIIACCQKIWMPGPVFFKQKRTGKNGKIFICYKFRSMDANNKADEYVDPTQNKYSFGNLLRASSIDELPQFWNVLKGEMSIIGPRPHMLVHDEEYTNKINTYGLRYTVRPGITGWAQVNGLRGERNIERVKKRIEYDLWYIQHWSIALDIKIIFLTIGVILKRGK